MSPENLKMLENEFSTWILDQVATPVFLIHFDTRIIHYVNKATFKHLGYEPTEVIGQSTADFYGSSSDRDLLSEALISQGFVESQEVVLKAKNGRMVWSMITAKIILLEGQKYILATLIDIQKHKKLRDQVDLQNQFLAGVAAAAPHLVFIQDLSSDRSIYCGPYLEALLGYNPQEFTTSQHFLNDLLNHIHSEDKHLLVALYEKAKKASDHDILSTRFRMQKKSGDWIWLKSNLKVYARSHDGAVAEILQIAYDITKEVEYEEQLKIMAKYDMLTGVANRSLFEDRLQIAMHHTLRTPHILALVVLDLDGFKNINDELGHPAGDFVLQEIAKRLQSSIRKSDTVARMGGDEFALILPEVTSKEAVEKIVLKCLSSIRKPMIFENVILKVAASIGIALYPADSADLMDLYRIADEAMYNAKKAGKNQFRFADYEMLDD